MMMMRKTWWILLLATASINTSRSSTVNAFLSPSTLHRQPSIAATTRILLRPVFQPSDSSSSSSIKFKLHATAAASNNDDIMMTENRSTSIKNKKNPVETFVQAYNQGDFITLRHLLNNNNNNNDKDCCITFQDAAFHYQPQTGGPNAIVRHYQLLKQASPSSSSMVIMDQAISAHQICILYQYTNNNDPSPPQRHLAFFQLNDNDKITDIYDSREPRRKTGAINLKILSVVGKLLEQQGQEGIDSSSNVKSEQPTSSIITPADRYYDAWSRRDMETAINVFADDCIYDDTVFPNAFENKSALAKHLYLCADSMPSTFTFCIDDRVVNSDDEHKIGVRWHVENKGEPMPFTNGCSFYTTTTNDNGQEDKIQTGIDIVEPAVWKLGNLELLYQTLQTKLTMEPIRFLPLATWIAYMYIVFLSDGILPGANALQLEPRTWQEVRDLSLNFWFISPILGLPFSPTNVHPILEGVFNLLLSWAGLFAGFLSDDRNDKPNMFPMLPAVVGMQFLTSAFLLPYLTLRTSEDELSSTAASIVTKEDLSTPTTLIGESRLLGPILGFVGASSILWGALARIDDFGGWSERITSFWQLMSIDRVGSSFLVDLVIFAIFQNWLVDDDLARRGAPVPGGGSKNSIDEYQTLRQVAKYIPFFGLAAYLTLRPSYPSTTTSGDGS